MVNSENHPYSQGAQEISFKLDSFEIGAVEIDRRVDEFKYSQRSD